MKFPPSYQMDQYTKYVYVRNYVKLHILKKNNTVLAVQGCSQNIAVFWSTYLKSLTAATV